MSGKKSVDLSSAVEFYNNADEPPAVSLSLFRSRLRRQQLVSARPSSADIYSALHLSSTDYKAKYGIRKTRIDLGAITHDLFELYSTYDQPAVTYRTFYQRAKRLQREDLLSEDAVAFAASSSNAEWIAFYGGGRRRKFSYDGELFPQLAGHAFSSVAAFLITIGRYVDRATVWSRMKAGWNLDDALSEPVAPLDDRAGLIYLAICVPTSQQYVGLTRMTLKIRWSRHIRVALEDKTASKIAQAIREHGQNSFRLKVLESKLSQNELPTREIYWIERLNTLSPNGLNSRPGGQMGSGRGKQVTYGNESFRSIEAGTAELSKRTGLAPHVVMRRLKTGAILPLKARKKSLHTEAGTNLWRRWKSLINGVKSDRREGLVDASWQNYDNFARDVKPGYDPALRLVRVDSDSPWGPTNFKWVSVKDLIDSVHGRIFVVKDVKYASLNEVARSFGIGRTTLKYRLEKGLTIEQAVEQALAPTSKNARRDPIVIGDLIFKSQNEAAKYAAATYGLSFDQARDRIRRGVPLDRNRPSARAKSTQSTDSASGASGASGV